MYPFVSTAKSDNFLLFIICQVFFLILVKNMGSIVLLRQLEIISVFFYSTMSYVPNADIIIILFNEILHDIKEISKGNKGVGGVCISLESDIYSIQG
jgi:hypothetical protein